MRRFFAAFLLIGLFCQSVAMAGQLIDRAHLYQIQQEALALEHDDMHDHGIPHHHDEHGLVVQDDSEAAYQHVLNDGGMHTAMLWSLPALHMVTPGSQAPPSLVEQAPAQAELDKLRRPPRSLS